MLENEVLFLFRIPPLFKLSGNAFTDFFFFACFCCHKQNPLWRRWTSPGSRRGQMLRSRSIGASRARLPAPQAPLGRLQSTRLRVAVVLHRVTGANSCPPSWSAVPDGTVFLWTMRAWGREEIFRSLAWWLRLWKKTDNTWNGFLGNPVGMETARTAELQVSRRGDAMESFYWLFPIPACPTHARVKKKNQIKCCTHRSLSPRLQKLRGGWACRLWEPGWSHAVHNSTVLWNSSCRRAIHSRRPSSKMNQIMNYPFNKNSCWVFVSQHFIDHVNK